MQYQEGSRSRTNKGTPWKLDFNCLAIFDTILLLDKLTDTHGYFNWRVPLKNDMRMSGIFAPDFNH
jgi:hypothetical protein